MDDADRADAEVERTLAEALRDLLRRDERNTCQHEETHRGGVLWEICNACGMKWADDEGGKPDWKNPPEWEKARQALAAHEAQAALAAEPVILNCEIQPRPLSHPLTDYHRAISEGPLHYTWQDKPHRLVYDLIAAVRFYAAPVAQAEPVASTLDDHVAGEIGYAQFAAQIPNGTKLFAAPVAQAEQWQPIETAPKDGRKLVLSYTNSHGNHRTVFGCWVTDEEAAETDADDVGLEAGWYELIDNWPDYTQVAIHEGEPSHWMPLPQPPKENKHD